MLITAAPCSIARAMPATELAQRISFGQADVERAHARPDAEDAAVVLGRGGDGGGLGPVRALEREAAERREVAAGELGVVDVGGRVDEREQRARGRHRRRDEAGVDDRGAPGGAGVERVGRRDLRDLGGPVGLGVEQQALGSQRGGELARAAARDDVGAGADAARAVAGGDGVGGGGRAGADDPVRARGGGAGVAGQHHRGRERRGARGGGDRQEEERDEEDQTAHRATVGTQSAHGRSGVPVRTARSSAGAGR